MSYSLEIFSLDLTFRVLLIFDLRSKDVYSKWKFGLSSFAILPPIAFKLRRFLYFQITAYIGSKRFKLKPFVFFLGKFLLVRVSTFLTILLK